MILQFVIVVKKKMFVFFHEVELGPLFVKLRWKRAEAKGEFASRILVSLPIAFHGFGHIPGGRAQPIRFSASQVLQNAGDLAFASQVNIRCFRAHCIEKRFLVALFRQVGNFNGI
jgi:hypothetical protein